MMNVIWCAMILLSFVYGAATGNLGAVADALQEGCMQAVSLCVQLGGGYMLWLGLFGVAEQAGLVERLARLLTPVLRRLFPGAPGAIPSITMNLAANFFGLGSAATPFGLSAMEHMQKSNPHKEVATHEMCLFIGLNCSAVELIPAGVIALRTAFGSPAPAAIIVPTFLASVAAAGAALGASLFLGRKRA